MNNGKRFEQNFKKSVPKNVFYYRFKDGTGAWDKGETRFQCSNICDCMLFDGKWLYLVELKNHKGKSLPFTAIRENQIKEMLSAIEYNCVAPILIVNFEEIEECYAIGIEQLNNFMASAERKSIPALWFVENGIQIPARKKKINTEYDLSVLFEEVKNDM
jgi:recombination protein U